MIFLGSESNGGLYEKTDEILEVIQDIYNVVILLCYLVLFILFMTLIRQNEEMLGTLKTQVVAFFSVMLLLLTSNFVLDIVFYVKVDPNKIADPV